DEYGQVVGGAGDAQYPASPQPDYQWQEGPGAERGNPQPARGQPYGGRDDGDQYGGYGDPESANGWRDGDYQEPPQGARIYREGDPAYGVQRGGPVPPAGVGAGGRA